MSEGPPADEDSGADGGPVSNTAPRDLPCYTVITHHPVLGGKSTLKPLLHRPDFSFRHRDSPGRFSRGALLVFPDGKPSVLMERMDRDRMDSDRMDSDRMDSDRMDSDHVRVSTNAHDGLLWTADRTGGQELVLVECRWSRARGIARSLPALPTLSLRGFVTGHPRLREPPEGGLASVEALFLATDALGIPDPTLLEGYRFAPQFLKRNGFPGDFIDTLRERMSR